MNFRLGSGRRAQPQQVVEQFHVLRHDQQASAPPLGDRRPFSCDGSSHDLRPLLTAPSVRFAVFSERFRDARFRHPRTSRVESTCSTAENHVDLDEKLWTTSGL